MKRASPCCFFMVSAHCPSAALFCACVPVYVCRSESDEDYVVTSDDDLDTSDDEESDEYHTPTAAPTRSSPPRTRRKSLGSRVRCVAHCCKGTAFVNQGCSVSGPALFGLVSLPSLLCFASLPFACLLCLPCLLQWLCLLCSCLLLLFNCVFCSEPPASTPTRHATQTPSASQRGSVRSDGDDRDNSSSRSRDGGHVLEEVALATQGSAAATVSSSAAPDGEGGGGAALSQRRKAGSTTTGGGGGGGDDDDSTQVFRYELGMLRVCE